MTNSVGSTIHLNEPGTVRVSALYARASDLSNGRPNPVHIVLGAGVAIIASPECAAELATKLNAYLAANKRANRFDEFKAQMADGGFK